MVHRSNIETKQRNEDEIWLLFIMSRWLIKTGKLIASINIARESPREMNEWTNACSVDVWICGKARTIEIPNCYSFIKLRPIVSLLISDFFSIAWSTSPCSWWCHTTPDEERKIRKFDDKQNVSFKAFEWNGWHNSWLHGCFLSCFTFSSSVVLRLLLNANSSTSRKAGERSENQINRVYYVIVFHPRTFIQKVTFRGRARKKEKLSRSSSSLPSLLRSSSDIKLNRSKIILLILFLSFSFSFTPIILRVICINQ